MTDVDDWYDPTCDDFEPDETAYFEQQAEEEYWEHYDQAHGGKRCDCPQVSMDVQLTELAWDHQEQTHGGSNVCRCPADEPPF